MAYDSTDFVVTEVPAPVHPSVRYPDRIRLLRDAILAAPQDFAMDDPSIHTCGSAVCFLGWTKALFSLDAWTMPDEAAPVLGLAEQEARHLFLMGSTREQIESLPANFDPFNATAEQGARVLTNYLATGKIDWSVA